MTGIIAIGQQATGVVALGQLATGIVAIGQLARDKGRVEAGVTVLRRQLRVGERRRAAHQHRCR